MDLLAAPLSGNATAIARLPPPLHNYPLIGRAYQHRRMRAASEPLEIPRNLSFQIIIIVMIIIIKHAFIIEHCVPDLVCDLVFFSDNGNYDKTQEIFNGAFFFSDFIKKTLCNLKFYILFFIEVLKS